MRAGVLVGLAGLTMSDDHGVEFAPQQLGQLRVGLEYRLFVRFSLATGNRTATRLDAGRGSVVDNAVEVRLSVSRLDQGPQRRKSVELVALGHELRGAGFDDFGNPLRENLPIGHVILNPES